MGRRVAFMGSPDFAVASLRALVESDAEVVGVITQPDRPAGRGRGLRPPPVKIAALALDLPVHQPRAIRKGRLARWLREREVDLAVVAAYGRILPDDVLSSPRLGCVNLHASLLPRWRGASPIHRALAAGDAQTGVCLMRIASDLDAGPVLARVALNIGLDDTAETLHDRLAEAGAALLTRHLDDLFFERLPELPQDESLVTFAPPLVRDEGEIDWRLPATQLHRHVRAMTPWPGAFSGWRASSERWKIFAEGLKTGDEHGAPGTLLALHGPTAVIACGEGALHVTTMQRPGKRRMEAASALRGARVEIGARLWPHSSDDQPA